MAISTSATAEYLSIPEDARNFDVLHAIDRSIVDFAAQGDLDGVDDYSRQSYEEIKKTDKI